MWFKESRRKWVIIGVLWFVHAVYFLVLLTIGTLAPFIQPDLNLTSAQIGLLLSAVSIGVMAMQIPSGIMSDFLGTKWVLGLGHVLMACTTLAISFTHSYLAFFLLLILLGIGIGCNQAPSSKAIMVWFPLRGRATAMGLKQTGINMGGILASLLLPAVALRFHSWRYSYRAAGLLSFLSTVLIFAFFQEKASNPEAPFQVPFSKKEIFRKLFLDRDFILICVVGVLLFVIQHCFMTYFFLYFTKALNVSIYQTGTLLAAAFAIGAAGRMGWSLLSDYVWKGKRKRVLILQGVIGTVSVLGLVLLKTHFSTGLVYLFVTLFALTGISWNAVYLTMAAEYPGKDAAGIATGIVFLISTLGIAIGPPLFGYLVDVTGAYTLSWLFVGFCMAMVALLSRIQRRERTTDE